MYDAFSCPGCQCRLTLPGEHAGKRVRCPKCSFVFAAVVRAPMDDADKVGAQDIGPIFCSPAFAPLRKRFPEPAMRGDWR